jgi:hypothetical protein
MDHGVAKNLAAHDLTRISDLDLASYLLCVGATLVQVLPTSEPSRRDFVLDLAEEKLVPAVRRFLAGQAAVEPRRYTQARRTLQRALRAAG